MSELVTGEAVALELLPAKFPSRALAVLLDLAAAMVTYIAVTMVLVVSTSSLDTAAQTALGIATFLLVPIGGPIAVETLSHGRSLGKLALGLRVVRDDGGPIRFRHALVRGSIGVVEILMTFGTIASIASLVSARGRRLGDVFAGTLVVRERIPVGQTGLVAPPPPHLAQRFTGLDLSAVPDGLWLAVRQYLTRMRQLDPGVSSEMAQRLAGDLAARTGAPLPVDLPPAVFLAAVVHERQSREVRQAGRPSGQDGFVAGQVPFATRMDVGPGAEPEGGAGGWTAGPAPAPVQPEMPAVPPVAPVPREQSGERPATGFAPPA